MNSVVKTANVTRFPKLARWHFRLGSRPMAGNPRRQKKILQEVQSTLLCLRFNGPTPCVENRRWNLGGVTYATLNILGACNNLCDTDPEAEEYAARNAADIEWMKETFQEAVARGSVAVMFISQGRHRNKESNANLDPGGCPRRSGFPFRCSCTSPALVCILKKLCSGFLRDGF